MLGGPGYPLCLSISFLGLLRLFLGTKLDSTIFPPSLKRGGRRAGWDVGGSLAYFPWGWYGTWKVNENVKEEKEQKIITYLHDTTGLAVFRGRLFLDFFAFHSFSFSLFQVIHFSSFLFGWSSCFASILSFSLRLPFRGVIVIISKSAVSLVRILCVCFQTCFVELQRL
ncbi:hypothetical protein F4775DRAFT_450242 [Biscogniauxia sp. FL1348]|nr:hypothetical protein F4775DRAFT_450242 [Biscogniauxia sp. FL1348]